MTDWLPPDDDLRYLYDAERAHPGPPAGSADRVRAAVLLSVATGAAVSTAAVASTSTTATATAAAASTAVTSTATGLTAAALAKPALVAAVVATAGGGLYLARPDVPPPVAPAPVVVVAPEPERPAPPPGLIVQPPEPTPEAPKPSKPKNKPEPSTPPTPTPSTSTPEAPPPETPEQQQARLAAERGILAEARAALAGGNAQRALVVLEAHRDRHPTGALLEEREALTVIALARGGSKEAAAARAEQFRAQFPASLFADAVADALR
jgi:hypothetical protein